MSATLSVNCAVLAKIAASFELPDYVKNAETESLLPVDSTNTDAYAAIRPELSLPIHSKAACWLSNMEYALRDDNQTTNEFTVNRLAKSATYFGIAADVHNSLQEYAGRLDKTAASNKKYPVRNRKEAKAAEEFLLKNAGTPAISDIDVCMLAADICHTLGWDANPAVQKMAGHGGVSDIQAFAAAVGGRTSFGDAMGSQNLDEINFNLFEVIKTAALLKTAERPWEAIQHESRVVKLASNYYTEASLYTIPKQTLNALCGSIPFYECDRVSLLQEKAASFTPSHWYLLKTAIGEPLGTDDIKQSLPMVATLLRHAGLDSLSAGPLKGDKLPS